MARASIPVDLFNPGQVFACLGFLEAAEALLGHAEAGFDWADEGEPRFALRVQGLETNPFEIVLEFLANSEVRACAPLGYQPPPDEKAKPAASSDAEGRGDDEEPWVTATPDAVETFPAPHGDPMALPVRVAEPADEGGRCLLLTHWADRSSRNDFKLYSGNRSAATIARAMLQGTRKMTSRKRVGERPVKTRGLFHLWAEHRAEMIARPFEVLTSMGGSFNLDPRGAWTSIDAGYSPNDQKHGVEASPAVEILAVIGLEHARPDEFRPREVRYGVWKGLLPAILARPALGAIRVGVPIRTFRFALDLAGKNKVVTFAQEEERS